MQFQLIILGHCSEIRCAGFPSYLTSCSPFHKCIIDVLIPILKDDLIDNVSLHPEIVSYVMPCPKDISLKLAVKYNLCPLPVVLFNFLFQFIMLYV